VGQALSARPDLLPQVYLDSLSELQDRLPSFPNEIAWAVIEEELGRPVHEVYEALSQQPVAAASLGQVYKGVLRGSGESVAVKVQRPGIGESIAVDMLLLRRLMGAVDENLPQVCRARVRARARVCVYGGGAPARVCCCAARALTACREPLLLLLLRPLLLLLVGRARCRSRSCRWWMSLRRACLPSWTTCRRARTPSASRWAAAGRHSVCVCVCVCLPGGVCAQGAHVCHGLPAALSTLPA
jgi:hypothetical protein